MKKPLYEINTITGHFKSGKKFNNETHGLIVKSNGNTATYLPKVFKNSIQNGISIKK